jgi:hypothetical protein
MWKMFKDSKKGYLVTSVASYVGLLKRLKSTTNYIIFMCVAHIAHNIGQAIYDKDYTEIKHIWPLCGIWLITYCDKRSLRRWLRLEKRSMEANVDMEIKPPATVTKIRTIKPI